MNPKLSIIIPSFNQGIFIAQTINSILIQSYRNFEIIVIDGGSTDCTLDILKSFNDCIFWLSEPDRGQSQAINKGIALAKGDVIAYLNSDDYYIEGTLERLADIFDQQEDILWVTGDYAIVDENGNKIQSAISKYKTFFRKRLSFNILTVLNPIIQPSTFIRRELITKIGLFDEELHYTMDYEYWLRAIKIQKPHVVKDALAAFRIHKNSKGGNQYKKQFKEELLVAKKYQCNQFLIFFHILHNILIGIVYRFLR